MERRVRFELLFRRHEPAVRAYALRRADAALADDVVAEVFLVCWRRFEDVPVDPLPWLLGVARNVIGTMRRGELRRTALRGRLADLGATEAARTFESPDGVLAAALARLNDEDRELLLLVGWEELSPRQVAAALALRPSTARVRLMRARRRLRSELARAQEGGEACVPTPMEAS